MVINRKEYTSRTLLIYKQLLEEAEPILERHGLKVGDYLRLALVDVVKKGKLPFELIAVHENEEVEGYCVRAFGVDNRGVEKNYKVTVDCGVDCENNNQ